MRQILTILFLLSCNVLCIQAQNDRQLIRKGNKAYRTQKFENAETDYRKATSLNKTNPQALYNLGCALQAQDKDSLAVEMFQDAAKLEKSKMRKAMCYHNIGAAFQKHQMFQQAIEAYKQSLRNNPNDHETRYNLALCQRQLKDSPQGGNSNDQDENGQNKKQEQQQQDQNKKDNNQQDQKQQQPKPDERMSKENAEQLLNAAMQEEKATQQRMKKNMQQQGSRRRQKNW